MFKLLEKDKENLHHRKDFEKIRDFINENTGFKVNKWSSSKTTLTITASAKGDK